MPVDTPRRPDEEIHGEATPKPLYSPGSNESKSHKSSQAVSPSGLKEAEQIGSQPMDYGRTETDRLGVGYRPGDKSTLGSRISSRLKGKVTKKRLIGGGVAGGVVGVSIFGFSIVQGPLQFVHFAQLLQQFHLRSNEDFGDSRTSKVLLYGLLGKGAERGQLSVSGNKLADSWEKKLVRDTGMRPVYNDTTGRFAGWEVIDNEKAKTFIDDYEQDGGEEKNIGDASKDGQSVRGSGKVNGKVNDNNRFLDFRDTSTRGELRKRSSIKSVSKATNTFRISSAVGFRLTAKRGNINLHPIKRILSNKADTAADNKSLKERQEEIRNKTAEQHKVGVVTGEAVGKDAQEVVEESNEVPEGTDKKTHRLNVAARAAGGPLIVMGLVCGVDDLGESANQVKYANNVMPMIRMGGGVVAMGNQAMSGDDIGLEELGAFEESLYDEETKTSWTSAKSIQAELGQEQTGPDIPDEGNIKNTADKPDFFVAVEKILGFGPGPLELSTACGAFDLASKIVPGFINDITNFLVNAPLGLAGTSTEELTAGLIAMINGEAVNTLAEGADFGNYANTGAFLAANDQAVSMGGTGLEPQEVAKLKNQERAIDDLDRKNQSYFARYLDIHSNSSMVSKVFASIPGDDLGSSFGSMPSVFANSLTGSVDYFMPKSSAASTYDYGVKKYGYSLDDQNNPEFEDPYINAAQVEPRLAELNEKYGKCFGMKVFAENGSITLESDEQTLNLLELENNQDYNVCNDDKDEVEFKQYRFYLADAQTTLSLACYEGDETACAQIGVSGGETTESSGSSASSSASCEQPSGTPKEVIDKVVVPIAQDIGFDTTVESIEAANAAHSVTTTTGSVSDHSGPPERAWAADISNGSSPTPEMDELADELASCFDIPWSGSGAPSSTGDGYRFQLIYRSDVGGNHYDHVHIGVAAQ